MIVETLTTLMLLSQNNVDNMTNHLIAFNEERVANWGDSEIVDDTHKDPLQAFSDEVERLQEIENERLRKIEEERLKRLEEERLRKAEEERIRQAEEDRLRKIEEEHLRKIEEEKVKQQQQQQQIVVESKPEVGYPYKNYRQTFYSVQQGEVKLGSGHTYQSNGVKAINNVMHFYDSQYGYLPIVAVNINEVLASGQNSRGVWNLYGSIVEMRYPNGKVNNAIVLDACGACSRANKIDLWVYNNDQRMDISGVDFRYIRRGWGN